MSEGCDLLNLPGLARLSRPHHENQRLARRGYAFAIEL